MNNQKPVTISDPINDSVRAALDQRSVVSDAGSLVFLTYSVEYLNTRRRSTARSSLALGTSTAELVAFRLSYDDMANYCTAAYGIPTPMDIPSRT